MNYYNIYTGEISKEDTWKTRGICEGWTPYYTLEGKYFGAEEGPWGYRIAQNKKIHVNSYWDLQPKLI